MPLRRAVFLSAAPHLAHSSKLLKVLKFSLFTRHKVDTHHIEAHRGILHGQLLTYRRARRRSVLRLWESMAISAGRHRELCESSLRQSTASVSCHESGRCRPHIAEDQRARPCNPCAQVKKAAVSRQCRGQVFDNFALPRCRATQPKQPVCAPASHAASLHFPWKPFSPMSERRKSGL